MIIRLEKNISPIQIQQIISKLGEFGCVPVKVNTQFNRYLICTSLQEFDLRLIGCLEGVADIHRVNEAYKLVSKKWKVGYSAVTVDKDVIIGDNNFNIMAGPCSIESEEQVISIVNHLKDNNIKIMRGGVFKPRSSPYTFRGLGIEGLKMFHEICKKNNIKIISEVMQVSQIDEMYPYVDIFQVGARNSQNFNLLDALGKVDKPVLIKRGISGTIDELLQSAEYVFSNGNEKIILCERGIRTFENAYRNTFDVNAIALLKQKTHLPVIADPSHGIGIRALVPQIALAATVAGADGIIYELHPLPEKASSDGQQTLNFSESSLLIDKINKIKTLLH